MISTLPVNEDKKSLLLNEIVETSFNLAEDYINLIAFTIKNEIKNKEVEEVISVYTDIIVSKMFEGFDKEQIISYISSGFLHEIRFLVMDKLYSHDVIKEAISV